MNSITESMIFIMSPVKRHLLILLTIIIFCLLIIVGFPGSIEGFVGKFWDTALWIGGCFS